MHLVTVRFSRLAEGFRTFIGKVGDVDGVQAADGDVDDRLSFSGAPKAHNLSEHSKHKPEQPQVSTHEPDRGVSVP